jgi:SpoVK/Ycf46/Vps4 family AAA+-type ATPase
MAHASDTHRRAALQIEVCLGLASRPERNPGYSASDLRFLVDEAARHALSNSTDIGLDSFIAGMSTIQPSVPDEVETQYRSIAQRGL